ncbi:hypothetical protein [uncultured Gimesia sp.]|uniref:hypothetical protein n=1 Tax=uncultured Gimesia sp. TaxID=1678688 RepID=UPI0030DA76CB
MNTKTIPNSLLAALKHRQKKIGTFCSIAGESSDLSLTCQTQPMVDEQLMSARAIINTPREDREGDIIVPQGVQLENFRKNPVVLWEHGLGELTRPIAKCQHPDGRLALEVKEAHISATSYFTEKCLESVQIFHLIAEGLVRATSVRAVPIKSFTRKTSNDGVGIVLEEWELIEWSWGALGVNPDAIARTIDRGTIEGRQIMEPLLKSLKAVLPPKNQTLPGWTPPAKYQSPKNTLEIPTGRIHDKEKMGRHIRHKNKSVKKKKVKPSESNDGDQLKAINKNGSVSGNPEYPSELIPLGAQVLNSIRDSILDLVSGVNSTAIVLENEHVKSYLKTFLQSLESERNSLENLYAQNYAHLNCPVENKADNHRNDFLSKLATQPAKPCPDSGTISHQEDSDQYRHLKSLSQSQNLTLQQRQVVTEILKHVEPVHQSRPTFDQSKLEQNVETLSQAVEELQQKLSDLLPA